MRIFASFLLFFITLSTSAQVFIPLAYWQAKRATLIISDATTYDYGQIAINTDVDKIFTLTNNTSVPATSIAAAAFSGSNPTNFTWKGGTFPGTGGDCGTTLAANTACSFVVTARHNSAVVRSAQININYSDGLATVVATRPLTATFIGSPTRLAWINTPEFIKFNTCVEVTIQAQDNSGNPINVSANKTVNLAINIATNTTFRGASDCSGSAITTRTITTGTNQVTFWVRSTTANQSGIMVASATGLIAATQNFYVTDTPTRLLMFAPPEIKTSPLGCGRIQVFTADSVGLFAAVSANLNVNLSTTGANVYYSNATCTTVITQVQIAAGTYQATAYTANLTAQTVTATASAGGYTSSNESILFAASTSWKDLSWNRRIRIDINNLDQNNAFSNQPVLVYLDSALVNYSHFKTNGADIVFVASDEITVLDHEIEQWDFGDVSQIWVRIPSIAAQTDKGYFYMYYNNPAAMDSQNKTGVWADYWAVWHLNENPSGVAPQYKDSTANTRDGTSSPTAPTSIQGVIGSSANLSSGSDYIQTVNLQPIIGNNSTFSCWMRTTQAGAGTSWQSPGITGIERSGSVDDIFFGSIDTSGNIGVGVGDDARATSGFVVNNNAWRHISITRSNGGQVVFYVNGVQTNTGTSRTLEIAAGVSFDRIGAIVAGQNYNGQLDEVRLIDSVQNAAKIKADFKYMMNTHLIYNSVETP